MQCSSKSFLDIVLLKQRDVSCQAVTLIEGAGSDNQDFAGGREQHYSPFHML